MLTLCSKRKSSRLTEASVYLLHKSNSQRSNLGSLQHFSKLRGGRNCSCQASFSHQLTLCLQRQLIRHQERSHLGPKQYPLSSEWQGNYRDPCKHGCGRHPYWQTSAWPWLWFYMLLVPSISGLPSLKEWKCSKHFRPLWWRKCRAGLAAEWIPRSLSVCSDHSWEALWSSGDGRGWEKVVYKE